MVRPRIDGWDVGGRDRGFLGTLPNPVSPGRAVGLTAIFMGLQVAFAVAGLGFASIAQMTADWPELFGLNLPMFIAATNTFALLVVVGIERRWRGPVWSRVPGNFGFKPIALLPAFTAAPGLALLIVSGLVALMEAEWAEVLHPLFEDDGLFSLRDHPGSILFLTVIVAPVTEEIFCRFMILGGLLQRMRTNRAILLSAALFAALHLNLAQLPATFLVGLLIGWAYARTRSLLLCIIMHAIHNGMVVSLSALLEPEHTPDWLKDVTWGERLVSLPATIGALGLLLLGAFFFRRLTADPTPYVPPPAALPPPPAPPPLPPGELRPCPPPAPPVDSASSSPVSLSDMSEDLAQLVTSIAERARAASHVLATVPTAQKNAALLKLAELIPAAAASLTEANAKDLAAAEENGLTQAQIDRLTLTPARLEQLAESVRQVADLPDPVGEALETTTRPNGLVIEKRRVPIGVIGIIYEARPNVTIDCAILCLKSGNAAILRGGKEIFHTNTALAALIAEALSAAELPADAVQLIPTTDRAALNTLLKLDELIHCIIPRGGEGLIRFVAQNSTIPVIKHYTGVCFVHLDRAADPELAVALTVNAKVQRPGVCNAAEQLLVDAAAAESLLPAVARALHEAGVELRGDAKSAEILAAADIPHVAAGADDFTAEFLGLIMGVQVVDDLESAIAIINRDSSGHSETIVTSDEEAAARFQAAVDSSAVFWNASTRFNDGFEFGFGAEIGISTDRLHARGPMGLPELCSYKYVVTGTGQLRG